MNITFLPQVSDLGFSIACRDGDVLVINGEAVDLSTLEPGDRVDHDYAPHPMIVPGALCRDDAGTLHVSVIRPVAHGSKEIETIALAPEGPWPDDVTELRVDRILTAAALAADLSAARAARIKALCERHIKAVLDDNTTKNLLAMATLGRFTVDQQAAFGAGQDWVAENIAECRRAVAAGDEPVFTDCPQAVRDLATEF